ncbi:pectate lyase [Ceratobasidium sp. AG-Ba]|nr:pectate lyase [Ceratobasidium sp. AG-Ba]
MFIVPYVAFTTLAACFLGSAAAAPSPTINRVDEFVRRDADAPPFVSRAASCNFPTPPKTSSLSAPITVTGTFDGGNVRFDRGSGDCSGQAEGGDADAVFLVQSGGTVQNVVIGANQAEGIHCLGPCNFYNFWFEDVCEDAITIKQTSGQSNIIGGGAKAASDKVVQHNGGGTVKIDSYCVQTFGKLYRSCGNCSTQHKRTVLISQIIGKSGSPLAGISSNYGDTATIDKASLSLNSVLELLRNTSEVPTLQSFNHADITRTIFIELESKQWPSLTRREIESVDIIIALIPGVEMKWSKNAPRRVTRMEFLFEIPVDSTRLKVYSLFVRTLEIYGRNAKDHEILNWRTLAGYAKGDPILPNLLRLTLTPPSWTEAGSQLFWIRIFLSPVLVDIHVVDLPGRDLPLLRNEMELALLKHIPKLASGLCRLSTFIELTDQSGGI